MRHKCSMSDIRMRKEQEDCLSSSFESSYDSKLGMGLERCVEANKNRQSLGTEVQKTLKLEILHLQKQLHDQVSERSALEKVLTNQALPHDPTRKNTISKQAEDLIKEISVLEFEVVYLEKYLLSLYRKGFQERLSGFSKSNQITKSDFIKKWSLSQFQARGILSKNDKCTKLPRDLAETKCRESFEFSSRETITDSSIHRSHSSLSHRFDRSLEANYHVGNLSEALNPYHSLPLSMLEQVEGDYPSNSNSLGEHLRKNIQDRIFETPNFISEEMIKTISFIYTQLIDPPMINHDFTSSPFSFSSPVTDSSPRNWKLDERRNWVFPSYFENNFTEEESKEFSGSYGSVIEVLWICRDSHRLSHVKQTLQHFRSLVMKLERVDLKRMKHEEKLAFWINVHNALVMHAYLVHGISQNSMKRISFILKAAYKIGGQAISICMIQDSILGCRFPRPGQWLHLFFLPKTKFKVKDSRRAYTVKHQEPRLYFALCSGSHSDPSVRLYTPKTIFQDLEAAKEDYIQTTLSVNKQGKILLPKIVELFSKESSLCPSSFMEMFGYLIPNSPRKSLEEQQNQIGKFWKRIQWVPHDFAFRFLISKELLTGK